VQKEDSEKTIYLDVSELEAPEPLIRAIRALEAMQRDEVLIFKHRMNPRHLFNEIAARGYTYEIIKDEPNEFIMKVSRDVPRT